MEGFEIKRRGDQEVDLKVNLYLEHSPEIHKLSPGLAKLLDIHSDTISNVIMALWQYAKFNRLQDVEDRRVIVCDEKLVQVNNILARFFKLLKLPFQTYLAYCSFICFLQTLFLYLILSGVFII